jgi:hypothetical protein
MADEATPERAIPATLTEAEALRARGEVLVYANKERTEVKRVPVAKVAEYPPDKDNAVDWLERRNFDRCMDDQEYLRENFDWFVRAAREKQARADAEKATVASQLAWKDAEARLNAQDAARKELAEQERRDREARERAETDTRREELKRGTVRIGHGR